MHCVYKIWFEGTDYFYIGSTVNFKIRLRGHKNLLDKNKHTNPKLQNVYNKYGDKFFMEPIYNIIPDKNNLALIREIELSFIKYHWGDKNLLNLTDSTSTPIMFGEKNPNYGKPSRWKGIKGKDHFNFGRKRPDVELRGKKITLLNIFTEEIKTFNSFVSASKELKISKCTISKLLSKNKPKLMVNGWVLPENKELAIEQNNKLCKSKAIFLKNKKNKILKFKDTTEAANYLNCQSRAISDLLKEKKLTCMNHILANKSWKDVNSKIKKAKKGANIKKRRPITLRNPDGILITFNSIGEAQQKVGTNIGKLVSGEYKHIKKWTMPDFNGSLDKNYPTKQFTLKSPSGEMIFFKSGIAAAKYLNCHSGSIYNLLAGKSESCCNGWTLVKD
jgi:hypothetical protein